MTVEPLRPDASDDNPFGEVVALWEAAGLVRPWNDPVADARLAAGVDNAAILVHRDGQSLVGAVMVGHDGHRGAVYYLAVHPQHRFKGIGRHLMAAAEQWLCERGIGKLNLMVRPDNAVAAGFYTALGYAVEERTVLAKRLSEAT